MSHGNTSSSSHKRQGPLQRSDDSYEEGQRRRHKGDKHEEEHNRNRDDHSTNRFGDAPGAYRSQRPSSKASRGSQPDYDRDHSEEPMSDRDERNVCRQSDMESMFRRLRSDIAADNEAALDARFSQLSVRVDELRTDVDTHEQRIRALEEGRAREAFESTEQPSVPVQAILPRTGLDRAAVPNLLKCNIDQRATVAIKEIENLLKGLVEEKGWDPSIARVQGDETASFFSVRFVSEHNGPEQADAIMDLLCDKSSRKPKWRELSVNDVSGTPVRVYLGKDEAPRISKLRGASKRLAKDILESIGDGHRSFFRPHDGKVIVDGSPCAKVEYQKDGSGALTEDLIIRWDKRALTTLESSPFNKDAVTAAFIARENTSWVS